MILATSICQSILLVVGILLVVSLLLILLLLFVKEKLAQAGYGYQYPGRSFWN